jgi:hypothetical protein
MRNLHPSVGIIRSVCVYSPRSASLQLQRKKKKKTSELEIVEETTQVLVHTLLYAYNIGYRHR